MIAMATRGLHVAIIMDGNGRWATARGLARWRGHQAGADAVRSVLRAAPGLGVATLTLYAFSSDNWKRPALEVSRLFGLLQRFLHAERAELMREGVRLSAIGRRDRLPKGALLKLERVEAETAHNARIHLRLALDYSARQQIAQAAAELAAGGEPIDAGRLGQALSGGVGEPDLLIRTGGEQRLSDFLLWELSYTELLFTPVLWPDFTGANLAAALAEFAGRERRFGGVESANGFRRSRALAANPSSA
ncbi:MAG TPA: polyprenyl diphosphate synthase [Limnochordia bacterium]|nr:polyprenyl diphosphate synthase [Limnochordia bacterium]